MTTRIAGLLLALAAAPATGAEWRMVAGESRLGFRGEQQGEPFEGRFRSFTPRIAFDPADPSATSIDVSIDMTSVDTRNSERDDTLATPDFFFTAKYPEARFRTRACRAGDDEGYVCEAELTIKEHTHPIAFPFTWRSGDGRAELDAQVTLDRTNYDVGSGDWVDPAVIAHPVTVDVHLVLEPDA